MEGQSYSLHAIARLTLRCRFTGIVMVLKLANSGLISSWILYDGECSQVSFGNSFGQCVLLNNCMYIAGFVECSALLRCSESFIGHAGFISPFMWVLNVWRTYVYIDQYCSLNNVMHFYVYVYTWNYTRIYPHTHRCTNALTNTGIQIHKYRLRYIGLCVWVNML